MADIEETIEIDKDENFYVSVSAHKQSFIYEIVQFPSEGAAGRQIGTGSNDHRQWVGKGAAIEGTFIQICVTQGGDTPISVAEIVVRLQIERGPNLFKDCGTWRIPPGQPSGRWDCFMLKFV